MPELLYFYLIIAISLISICMYHISLNYKNIWFTRFSQTALFLSVIIGLLFYSGFLVKQFGTNYTYQNAPREIKENLNLFIVEAKKRNVDPIKISSLKIIYLDWDYHGAYFAGACDKGTNTLLIPSNKINPIIIFHELGHCIFDYSHLISPEDKSEIMYYALNPSQKLDNTSLDSFFNNQNQIVSQLKESFSILLNPWAWLNFSKWWKKRGLKTSIHSVS